MFRLVFACLVAFSVCPPGLSHAQAPETPRGAISPGAATFFGFESDPNDYLGAGRRKLLTEADGVFEAVHEPGVLLIEFRGAPGASWSLEFQVPRGGDVLPGRYDGAVNAPSPRKPGLAVSGEGRACQFTKGYFEVREAVYAANGDVERLAIDFELHCSNLDPIFFGYVRVNSAVPVPAQRTPTPTPGPEQFVLTIDSQPGDPVGGGVRKTVTGPNQVTRADYYPWVGYHNQLTLQRHGRLEDWELNFAAPACQELLPGTYEGAQQVPFQPAEVPGLEIERFGSTCTGLDGRFVVREAHYGEDREVYRFVADFEQRCRGTSGTLFGSVSYTSVRPTPTPAPPSPTPTDYSSLAAFYSEPGDWVGYCRSYYLTLAEGDFSAWHRPGFVIVFFEGGARNTWSFEFEAPLGQELLPGTYQATGAAPAYGTEPAMNVGGQGRGCGPLTGEFTVHEAEYGEGGEVLRFAADFVQYCSGIDPPLHGSVHYRSGLPPPTPRGPDAATPTRRPRTPTPPGPCAGDCNGDGHVTIDELILAVSLAVDALPVDACLLIDQNADRSATINEIVTAVRALLADCHSSPATGR